LAAPPHWICSIGTISQSFEALHSGCRVSSTMYIGHIGFGGGQVNEALYASTCEDAIASMRPLLQQPTFGTATQSVSAAQA
jgi:hypothetical protein